MLASTETLVMQLPDQTGLERTQGPKFLRRELKWNTTGRHTEKRQVTPKRYKGSKHSELYSPLQPSKRVAQLSQNPSTQATTDGLVKRGIKPFKNLDDIAAMIGAVPLQPGRAGNRVIRPMQRLPPTEHGNTVSASPKLKISFNLATHELLGSQNDSSTAPSRNQQEEKLKSKPDLRKLAGVGSDRDSSAKIIEKSQPKPIIVVRRPGKIRTEPGVSKPSVEAENGVARKPVKSIFSRIHKAEKASDGGESNEHTRNLQHTIDEILQQPLSPEYQTDMMDDGSSKLIASPEENSVVSTNQPAVETAPHRQKNKHKTAFVVSKSRELETRLMPSGIPSERSPFFQRESSVPDLLGATPTRGAPSSFLMPSNNQNRESSSTRQKSHSPQPQSLPGEARHVYASFKKKLRDTEANILREEVRRRRDLAEIKWDLSPDAAPTDALRTQGIKLGFRMGKGAFGEVFEAYDEVLRQPVAVKVIDKKLGSDHGKLFQMVKQEVEMWKLADKHDHVCELFRLCEDQKKVRFFVHNRFTWYWSFAVLKP